LVKLAIPFTLAFRSPTHATTPRKRRDIGIDVAASCRGSFAPHVYIDAIGVPRGVPNEFKTRDSNCSRIWISSLLFMVAPHK
jgi:hypothetical protein